MRQQELERRADDINRILKSFGHHSSEVVSKCYDLPLQTTNKDRPLFVNTSNQHDGVSPEKRYESPKFFVGSGSPKCAREEGPAAHSKHNSGEIEQFSF